jgi:phosphopantetheinyl transferase (holo-ACP synthase)
LSESMQQLLHGKNIKKHHVSITHSYLVASSVVVLEYA